MSTLSYILEETVFPDLIVFYDDWMFGSTSKQETGKSISHVQSKMSTEQCGTRQNVFKFEDLRVWDRTKKDAQAETAKVNSKSVIMRCNVAKGICYRGEARKSFPAVNIPHENRLALNDCGTNTSSSDKLDSGARFRLDSHNISFRSPKNMNVTDNWSIESRTVVPKRELTSPLKIGNETSIQTQPQPKFNVNKDCDEMEGNEKASSMMLSGKNVSRFMSSALSAYYNRVLNPAHSQLTKNQQLIPRKVATQLTHFQNRLPSCVVFATPAESIQILCSEEIRTDQHLVGDQLGTQFGHYPITSVSKKYVVMENQSSLPPFARMLYQKSARDKLLSRLANSSRQDTAPMPLVVPDCQIKQQFNYGISSLTHISALVMQSLDKRGVENKTDETEEIAASSDTVITLHDNNNMSILKGDQSSRLQMNETTETEREFATMDISISSPAEHPSTSSEHYLHSFGRARTVSETARRIVQHQNYTPTRFPRQQELVSRRQYNEQRVRSINTTCAVTTNPINRNNYHHRYNHHHDNRNHHRHHLRHPNHYHHHHHQNHRRHNHNNHSRHNNNNNNHHHHHHHHRHRHHNCNNNTNNNTTNSSNQYRFQNPNIYHSRSYKQRHARNRNQNRNNETFVRDNSGNAERFRQRSHQAFGSYSHS